MTEPVPDPVKPPRSLRTLLITVAGLVALFYAVVLNLVPVAPDNVARSVAESLAFSLVAIACGVWCLRRRQRFLSVAMIGPSVFILAESAVRLAFFLQHGKGI